MLLFGFLGPIIRRRCPEGFVLTEWTRQRYGTVAMLYLSFMTLFTLFLYMVSELSALGQVVTLLTGLDGLPAMIVQCAITTIYTCKCCLLPTLAELESDFYLLSSRWFQDLFHHGYHPGSHGHRSHHHRHYYDWRQN
jgi:hypothetical protein